MSSIMPFRAGAGRQRMLLVARLGRGYETARFTSVSDRSRIAREWATTRFWHLAGNGPLIDVRRRWQPLWNESAGYLCSGMHWPEKSGG